MIGSTLAQRGVLTSSSSSSSSSSATPQKRTASSGHSGKAGEEAVHTPIIFLTPWIKVPLKAPGMLFASYIASAATKALAYPQTSPISKLLGVGESVVLAAGVGLFSISAYLYYSRSAILFPRLIDVLTWDCCLVFLHDGNSFSHGYLPLSPAPAPPSLAYSSFLPVSPPPPFHQHFSFSSFCFPSLLFPVLTASRSTTMRFTCQLLTTRLV